MANDGKRVPDARDTKIQFLMLKLRDLIADKEFFTAAANQQLNQGGSCEPAAKPRRLAL